MILVDTSIIIDSFRGLSNPKVEAFKNILQTNAPYGISVLTFKEVLQGAKNEKEHKLLESYLSTVKIFYLPDNTDFYKQSAYNYMLLRQKGKTISNSIDMLIAMTAIYNGLTLLHNNKDFDKYAQEINKLNILKKRIDKVCPIKLKFCIIYSERITKQ